MAGKAHKLVAAAALASCLAAPAIAQTPAPLCLFGIRGSVRLVVRLLATGFSLKPPKAAPSEESGTSF